MKVKTLADLYLDQLQDTHSCERQIIKALPKMMKAAVDPELKTAFKDHLEVTKEHVERLDLIFDDLGKRPGRKVCEATVGLVEEGSELIENTDEGDVRDVGLICAAQKIEHYEIACYGCLRTIAALLGRESDVELLDRTLGEEKLADVTLTNLAMSHINSDAANHDAAIQDADNAQIDAGESDTLHVQSQRSTAAVHPNAQQRVLTPDHRARKASLGSPNGRARKAAQR